jgi:hypothetical protein
VREETCEQKGKTRFVGTLLNKSTGEKTAFDPSYQRMPLQGGLAYEVTIDALNEGLCRQFHFDYTIDLG